MSLERIVRKLLVPKGDVNAAQRGRIARRVGRRIYGKATGRLAPQAVRLANTQGAGPWAYGSGAASRGSNAGQRRSRSSM
jgi:hypothetical protein